MTKITHLDTISPVHLDIALVILPHDAELNHTFGDLDDGESTLIFGIGLEEWLEGGGEFLERLVG